MNRLLEQQLLSFIAQAGRAGVSRSKIITKFKRVPAGTRQQAERALCQKGKIVMRSDRYYAAQALKLYPAKIVRINKTFGFAQRQSDGAQIFLPGRYTLGALEGDQVLLKPISQWGDSEEGQVYAVTKPGPSTFSGSLVKQNGKFYVLPDHLTNDPVPIKKDSIGSAQVGEKVVAKVVRRGDRHRRHLCRVVSSFGDAQNASACAAALVVCAGISREFPLPVLEEADRVAQIGITAKDRASRTDLTDLPLFTIDGADSKDLDDAISIQRDGDGYRVGVHIADVSHYIRRQSTLDKEAFLRGTSIYYADQVIPMVPQQLSNGICSLNPQEDRLAFSAWLLLSAEGKLRDFNFEKTIIRSRVKGVYSEVNRLLAQDLDPQLVQKYQDVLPQIKLAEELYQKLRQNRLARGVPPIESDEAKFIFQEDGQIADVVPRVQGKAEGMIEELMLLANQAAATLAMAQQIPFIYRVHEPPTPDKAGRLKELLDRLGLPARSVRPEMKPSDLADILTAAQGKPYQSVLNQQVLRAMSKAIYSKTPIGHYGLALENYAHFTSPIRRYPDLAIHRILTDFLVGRQTKRQLDQRYGRFVEQASVQATDTELVAMQLERSCEDCYKAEYMQRYLGQTFDGVISGMIEKGLFVMLPNTIEGYIPVEQLGVGFQFDGFLEMRNPQTGMHYTIGQAMHVVCEKASVDAGQVTFGISQA